MSRQAIGLVLVLALAVTVFACQKLPTVVPTGPQLASETLTRPDAIPAAWGNLVGVSTVGQYPTYAQLWFQDDQKVIRMVTVRMTTTTMDILNARLIRRN